MVSRNTLIAQALPQARTSRTGLGNVVGGISSGLRGFHGLRGAMEDADEAEKIRLEKVSKEGGGLFGDSKNELSQLERTINDPRFTSLPQESQDRIKSRASNVAKDVVALEATASATEKGKQVQKTAFEPEREGLKEQATQDVRLATEPQIQADITTKKAEATRQQKNLAELGTQEADFSSLSNNIDNLEKNLEENPELVGLFADTRGLLGKATGGKLGFSKEQLEKRGEVVNQVSVLGFQMLKFATDAGLSGINTVTEAKRAIGNLTKESSAEEIKGAMKALKVAKEDILNQQRKKAGVQKETQQQEFSPEDIEAELKRRGL